MHGFHSHAGTFFRAAALAFSTLALSTVAQAQDSSLKDLLAAVVKISAEVPAEARTARGLGTRREGNGVVIDSDGLVLTIGYLILESESARIGLADGKSVPARVVAYDHETGFGLLRAETALGVKPLDLGDSERLTEKKMVLVAGHGGKSSAIGAFVVSRRDFAGYWEYLLENAIFTSPPHPNFGGAALIDENGTLVGIGSLIVPNAAAAGEVSVPGNLFVPINALKPILGDLLAKGRAARTPRPWLGLYSEEVHGRVFVTRVPPGGPAHAAGLRPGDLILAIAGKPVNALAGYYRKLWSLGRAGVAVPLTVLHGDTTNEMIVHSIDRYDWFIRKPSY